MLLPSVEICLYVSHNSSIYTEQSLPLWYHYMMINEKSVWALITAAGHERISRSTANTEEQIWERERKVCLLVTSAVSSRRLHLQRCHISAQDCEDQKRTVFAIHFFLTVTSRSLLACKSRLTVIHSIWCCLTHWIGCSLFCFSAISVVP